MKKIVKSIMVFFPIILIMFLINPYDTCALSASTNYKSIEDTERIQVSGIDFLDISFKNHSLTSTQAFGLTASIVNNEDYSVDYLSTISYYDKDYVLIAKSSGSHTAPSGVSIFNQMSNLNILNGYSVDDIYYYDLSITVDEDFGSTGIDTNSSVTPSKNSEYSSYDYVIDNYDINVIVNENNTFDITETITAYFNVSKHGIYRIIPMKNKITRLDGSSSTNRTQITNVSVDNEYTTSREKGNYKLQIGSVNRTLIGEQKYVIKYTYNIGKDPVTDYDELYYNLIGNEWDTVIGNVTFKITMPKEFDSSKLGFSSGIEGSIDNSNIKYNVSGNEITGSYNGVLNVGEALTVRCELPEGYFVGAGLQTNSLQYLIFIIPILFLGISLFLWYKFGRDDQVVETIEFYPPEGFNSLEVGFLYKGKANEQDVTSLLVYLANKGYIKITETEDKNLFSKSKGFKLTKLKEYDGNNINEQMFLAGLFKKKPTISSLFGKNTALEDNNVNEVTAIDLYDNFYITMAKILSNVNNKENKNKIFEKQSASKKILVIIMIVLTYCLITIPPIVSYDDIGSLPFAIIFPMIGFAVTFCLVFGENQTVYVNGKATNSTIASKLFGLIWGAGFGGIPWAIVVLPVLLIDPIYLIGYMIGIVCVIGMFICLKYLPKRTPYGNEILGKLKGFKNFLEVAEKDRLESMVMQDPSYFYNILPYTYVLGVSDKWIKKFETISLQAPSWYDSSTAFSVAAFGSFMSNTMSSAQSSMSSSPSSSSGGSSGGGSSGGGSGGGGGGSW